MQESHQALYRQWRPQIFDEIVGQDAVVKTLRQAVLNSEIGHAYLFSGVRGTGKTSLAKIFARAVNCLKPQNGNPCNRCEVCEGILRKTLLDVIEMDAASNNSVEDVRRIIEEIQYLPVQARYKVYIIDEVHMLSTAAFNALLKTLEEPPEHGIFILATTEPQRLPATILSRCQRYDFQRISPPELGQRLRKIAAEVELRISDEALELISLLADGALRDAISLLDQCRTLHADTDRPIERQDILTMTGRVNDRFMLDLLQALLRGDSLAILSMVENMAAAGQDYTNFAHELSESFRNLFILRSVGTKAAGMLTLPRDLINDYADIARSIRLADLRASLEKLSTLLQDLRWSPRPRIALETFLLTLNFVPCNEELPPVHTSKLPGSSAAPVPHDTAERIAAPTDTAEQTAPAAQADTAKQAAPAPQTAVRSKRISAPAPSDTAERIAAPTDTAEQTVTAAQADTAEQAAPAPQTAVRSKRVSAPAPSDTAERTAAPTDTAKQTVTAAQADTAEANKAEETGESTLVSAEELEARWDELFEDVDWGDSVFLQFTLRHFKRDFNDGVITVYFAPEHSELYNGLQTAGGLNPLERACRIIYKERSPEVRLFFEDGCEAPRPAKIKRDRSAWLSEAKRILEENGIRYEEEN